MGFFSFIEPPAYGFLHLLYLFVIMPLAIFLAFLLRTSSIKKQNKVFWISGVIFVILELVRIIYCWVREGAFNFNFLFFMPCSIPMVFALIIPLLKNNTVRRTLCLSLATYSFFGGLVVLLFPFDIMGGVILTQQSLMFHTMMMFISTYCGFCKSFMANTNEVRLAFILYFVMSIMAILGNVLNYQISGIVSQYFFLSPYELNSLYIFNIVQQLFGFPAYFVVYEVSFFLFIYLGSKLWFGICHKKMHYPLSQTVEINESVLQASTEENLITKNNN